MNKVLITLSIFSLLISSAWGTTCPTGTLPLDGISACAGDPSVASACVPGFVFDGTNACTPCAAGQHAPGGTGTTACFSLAGGKWAALRDATAACADTAAGCPPTDCVDGKGAAALSDDAADCSVTCTQAGAKTCLTAAGAAESITCLGGYYLALAAGATAENPIGTCTACGVPNCKTCTSTGTAFICGDNTKSGAGCQAGYFRNHQAAEGTAATDGAATTDKCEECTLVGCAKCEGAKDHCQEVKVGYILTGTLVANKGHPTVGKCETGGNTNDSATGTACATPCPVNCNACMADKAKCTACKAGYKLESDLCANKIDDTKQHPTCDTANGETKDNCLTCVATHNRELVVAEGKLATDGAPCKCKAGFGDPASTATDKNTCVACGTDVKTCDYSTATPTIVCKTATAKVSGINCEEPPAAGGVESKTEGWFWSSATPPVLTKCNAVCKTCTGPSADHCKTCVALTDVEAAKPKEDDPKLKQYLKATWLNGTSCHKVCPTGFQADADMAKCEAASGSNSVLLSAIALIFSLFLIF